MGSPMHHTWGTHGHGPMQVMYLPFPMAMFGVVIAFMFGATLGMKVAEKRSGAGGPRPWMMGMGMGPKPWMRGQCGPKPWMMGGMSGISGPWMAAMAHHHHGTGTPGCCEQHGAAAGEQQQVEEDPEHAREGE